MKIPQADYKEETLYIAELRVCINGMFLKSHLILTYVKVPKIESLEIPQAHILHWPVVAAPLVVGN